MPSEFGVGAGLVAKYGVLAKIGALIGSGAVGAFVIAAVDPPKTRLRLFVQALVAGVASLYFTGPVVRAIDHYSDWINLSPVAYENWLDLFEAWAEVAMPVGLLVGALSWGIAGALAKLRDIVSKRGADIVAGRLGIEQEGRSDGQ